MGSELIIVVFAVVVIGGMGSILGAIVTRIRSRRHRRFDEGIFPRGVQHGDLRHYGDCAAGPASGFIRAEGMMEHVADPLVKKPSALRSQSETIGFVIMTAGLGDSAFCDLSAFPDASHVFCAVCVRLQPVDRICRSIVIWPRALFRVGELSLGVFRESVGLSPELAILTGTATAAVCGLVAGSLAIRRQGIYFAMITLALAQMMYFFALQAKFTGGEDGIQAVPRGILFGSSI